MRSIETHKVNGLNEALAISVVDEPGHGGMHHKYRILVSEEGQESWLAAEIRFQNGPIKEHGVNGVSNEALLAIVRDRLECAQRGDFACTENQDALDAVVTAMNRLHDRTKGRMARGVEGTNQK